MASGNRDSSEYLFEEAGRYDVFGNINSEAATASMAAEGGIEDEDDDADNEMMGSVGNEGDMVSRSSAVISQQWPQSFREASDIYLIAASPCFGILHSSLPRAGSSVINNEEFRDSSRKMPLLSDHKIGHQAEDVDKVKVRSMYSDKLHFTRSS